MASAKDLREKTDQELVDQLALEKKRLFDATVRGASGETIKPHEKQQGKKLIARIETILQERSLRKVLTGKAGNLKTKASGATPKVGRLAEREPRPHLGRVRVRGKDFTLADRFAVKLAETRRLQAALVREDPGEGK